MKRLIGILSLAATLPLVGCASKVVVPFEAGETVALQGIEDQHGQAFNHQDSMKALLFVDGMDAKKIAQDSLKTIDTACMDDGKLVYLANISGMPSLISTLIAVPKMRKYPYSIWLDKEGDISEKLPQKEDQVSLLKIENQVISAANFYADSGVLSQVLTDICGVKP